MMKQIKVIQMNKHKKGSIEIHTGNSIKVSLEPSNSLQAILKDLKNAAETVEFIGNNNEIIDFSLISQTDDKLYIKMENFDGITFMDSLKDAPEERQNLFKMWSKFWSQLVKLGYQIK